MSFAGRIDIAENAPALARRAAEWIVATIIQSPAPVRIALSGGDPEAGL